MTATDLPIDAHDKNPFDRVLVAQAAHRNLTIVTNDSQFLDAALTPTIKT